jgi:hypothetical protein
MIRPMKKRTMIPAGVGGACVLALVGCAGGEKQASAPGTCPDGTVLSGQDCLPIDARQNESSASSPTAAQSSQESPGKASESTADAVSPSASPVHTPYDKDAVEVELKRAARQIKANCGAATDDEGKATGPWGTTKATVVLGRNGHVKQVSIPAPYEGRPVGVCAVDAFEKIWFPPYAGSTDASVDWEIVITPPKHH